jgi:hypothetical protein
MTSLFVWYCYHAIRGLARNAIRTTTKNTNGYKMHYQKKKTFRTGYIKNLAPVIQPILKVCGAKYYITGAKRWC